MTSKLEERIREEDNSRQSVSRISRIIAKELKVKIRTVENYLYAKRAGFDSYTQYKKHLTQNAGFKTYQEYIEHLARNKGYSSIIQMQDENARKRGDESHNSYEGRIRKIKRILGKDPIFNKEDKLIYVGDSIELLREPTFEEVEARFDLEKILGFLDNRSRKIIEEIYLNEKTFSEIGKELGISSKRVYQIKETSLKKLREISKEIGAYPETNMGYLLKQLKI